MLNFNSVMIGTHDSKELAAFYEKVLAKEPDWQDGDWYGFTVGNGSFAIGPHSEVSGQNPQPGRIVLNFESKESKSDFDRIKATGAKVIKDPFTEGDESGMNISTFSDPDGNYFQICPPWEE